MLKSTSSTKGPLTQGKALIQLIKDDLALNKLWLVSLNNDCINYLVDKWVIPFINEKQDTMNLTNLKCVLRQLISLTALILLNISTVYLHILKSGLIGHFRIESTKQYTF